MSFAHDAKMRPNSAIPGFKQRNVYGKSFVSARGSTQAATLKTKGANTVGMSNPTILMKHA
jgi:hypothetical protein